MNQSLSRSALATALLGASLLAGGPAVAEISANIGVTSNYIWRGVTQTADGAAVSGGFDLEHTSGLYAGTWTSNIAGGYELDLYAGYAGEAGPVTYDAGFIAYLFPNDDDDNFEEIYLGIGYGLFEAMVSYDPDNRDMYVEAGFGFELGGGVDLGLRAGRYRFDDDEFDYTDYALSLNRGDFSFTLTDMSENALWGQSDNVRVAASWSATF